MLKIVQDSPEIEAVLKTSDVQRATHNAICAIIAELPEDARTVETIEYVISEMGQALKEKQVL